MGALRVVVGGDDGRARVSRKTSRTRRVVRAVHDVDVFIIGLFAHGAVEDVARVRRGAVVGFHWDIAGFTSHSVLWTGGVHTFSQAGALAVFTAMCVMQIMAFTQKNKRVLTFMRRRRLTLILLNIVFLGVVEWNAIKDFKTMLFIQLLSKVISPWYFMRCTRFDAKHRSYFEIPGVWSPHENWHVMILVVHLLQLRALVAQAR